MRIGILFSPIDPKAGGSFTFVSQILEAIVEHSRESENQFVFISTDFRGFSNISQSDEVLKLSGFRTSRILALQAAVKSVSKFALRKGIIDFAAIRGYAINRKLQKAGIEMVWSLEPLSFPLAIPFVTTLWDIQHRVTPYFPEVSSQDDQWIKRERAVSRVLRQAALILVGTQRGASEIVNAYGVDTQRIFVSPFPAPENNFSAGIARSTIQFVYPAQFWPHKNHVTLIRAFGLARERTGMDLQLVLSGSDKGTKKNLLSLTRELGLESCINFPGFVSRAELITLYRNSGMMLFPTFCGPDNLPPLEAMAFGCPVAVSDIPGAREQFGEAALYFNPNSAEELAEVIISASQNPAGTAERVSAGLALCELRTSKAYVRNCVAQIESFSAVIANKIVK